MIELGQFRVAKSLMPKKLVLKTWKAISGHEGPRVISPEMEAVGAENVGSREAFINAMNEDRARQMAYLFKVSTQAMLYRLHELGLLPRP